MRGGGGKGSVNKRAFEWKDGECVRRRGEKRGRVRARDEQHEVLVSAHKSTLFSLAFPAPRTQVYLFLP